MIGSLRAGAACVGAGLLFLAHAMPAAAQETPPAPTVTYPNSTQSSAPLWTAPGARASVAGEVPKTQPIHPLPQGEPVPGGEHANDRALQNKAGQHLSVEPRPAFQGIIQDGFVPSDQNIAVGPNHIVQVVNSEIAILDKNGIMDPGYPKALNNLWTGLGGACAQSNNGDPIVQYDRLADRWIVTQLASLKSPFAECIAVSKTSDPSGSYNLYSYNFGTNLNDYPKFTVWPTTSNSAYLGTYNLFANGNSFVGADLCAYDRTAMLAGAPAPAQVCFQVSDGGVLPSDLDGSTAPIDGEPGYFLDFSNLTTLALRTLSPNFATPGASTLSAPTNLTVAAFQEACGGGTCIPQPGTSRKLNSLGDRLMYRLAYRNFGTHESMVVNHSVVAGSSVAPRWYQLDASVPGSSNFVIKQQGTYAPDASYRWMGSVAMDQLGDIALGYSLSSSTVFPSIVVTGRTPSDPAGVMEGETVLQAGAGSQTGTTRWGDYSSMRIDPADDCTFWYTNQFYPKTASANWYTYIGSFKFSSCGGSVGGGGSGDFSLALNGVTSPITLVGGASESNSTVTVSPSNGFTSDVTLTSTCTATISCKFVPNPVAGANGTSTLTVSVANNAPSGSAPVTITGTGGGITHSTAAFTVTVPAAHFTLGAAPSSITVKRGSNSSASIMASDVASGTTNSPVSLTLVTGHLPRGVSASLSSNSVGSNGGSSTLKITVNRNAPGNTSFSVTINGSDGNASSVTVPVIIQ